MAELLFRRGGSFWHDTFWHDMAIAGMSASVTRRSRAYRILVDGKECATIKQNSEVRVSVIPGKHNVQLRVDWCSSPSLEIMAVNERIEIIECGPNSKLFREWVYISFLRKDYIWIKRKADNLPEDRLSDI